MVYNDPMIWRKTKNMFTVSITGNSTEFACYISVDGNNYNFPATISVEDGTEIFYYLDPGMSLPGGGAYVYLNGDLIEYQPFRGGSTINGTYTVTKDCQIEVGDVYIRITD